MKKFEFQFASLLNLRENNRQLCRVALAKILQDQQQLELQQQAIQNERNELLQQIRQLSQAGNVNVNEAASRRYYAGQLKLTMQAVMQQQQELASQLEACRQQLIKADQEVKALEQLAEKQFAAFQYEQQKMEAHELEDTWLASQKWEPVK